MKGFFENELGRIYIEPGIVTRLCVLPELALSKVFVLPSGPLSTDPADQVNRKGVDRHVHVDFTPEGEVMVEIRLLVRYGPSIRTSAAIFQEKVGKRVEATTGLRAKRVDVKVDGIYRQTETTALPPPAPSEPRAIEDHRETHV